MKKVAKVVLCVMAVMMMAFCMTGCASGKYVCKSELAGTTLSVETIELKMGKKCVKTTVIGDKTETTEGTYVVDGENITLTFSGVDVKGTLKDGTITIGLKKYVK